MTEKLTFFPTPYPGEWWYSILCRFFQRTGYSNYHTATKELYGGRAYSHGRLFPGIDCSAVVERLPAGILDIEKILLEHTLAPFYLRMYPKEKKQETINLLKNKQSAGITSIETKTPAGGEVMKFCPLCYEEDREMYGEPYWYREWQIPLMSVCLKHRCRLEEFNIGTWGRLAERYYPLSEITPRSSSDSEVAPWELTLNQNLMDYLELPFDVGPTTGYNNLMDALIAKEQDEDICTRTRFSTQKLYDACARTLPLNIMSQYFEKPSATVFHRIDTWTLTGPERYALLETIAEVATEDMFGPEQVHGHPADAELKRKMLLLKEGGTVYRKKDVAQKLGVSPAQLSALSRRYRIAPFWKQTAKGQMEKRDYCLRINLKREEEERLKRAAKRHGDGQYAVFARALLLKALEELEEIVAT